MNRSRLALVLLAFPLLAAGKPDKAPTMPSKRPPDREVGRGLWKQSCWQCHGESGRGDGPTAAALVGGVPSLEGKIREDQFEALIDRIQSGVGRMPAYAENIDRADSRRILLYLRDQLTGRTDAPEDEGEEVAGTPDEDVR
jgi:cytochrome c oxidase cbb3-type subunit 3